MHFVTVFDLDHVGYRMWPFVIPGVLFMFMGAELLRTSKANAELERATPGQGPLPGLKQMRLFGWAMLVFSTFWTIFAGAITYLPYRSARLPLDSGHYSVVQGRVTDFIPMPYTGRQNESFTVGGKTFSYSDYMGVPGFNNTHSHRGPITEGVYVRVSYVGNDILRLEIAE